MTVRTGDQYLAGLGDARRVVYDGHIVTDIHRAPVFRRQAAAVAQFYDFQSMPELRELMTYEAPDGERCGIAFLEPKSREDLRRRAAAYAAWAEVSCGLLGRSPDYMNAMLTSFAGLAAAAESEDPEAARPLREAYLEARRRDHYYTHTFVYPFYDHNREPGDNPTVLRVVRETAEGIFVSGARGIATGAPIADRNFNLERIRPPGGSRGGQVLSLIFSTPVAAEGLSWICRDVEPTERSTLDAPLVGLADEVDAVAVFEEVFVPWADVAGYATDFEKLGRLATLFAPWGEQLTKHHALVRFAAKTKLILGLAHIIAESSGSNKYINVQQRLGDILLCLDTLEGLAVAAIEHAERDPASGWYYPNARFCSAGVRLFGEYHPRIVDHLLSIGASRFVSTPQERTLEVLGAAIEPYFKGSAPSAKENVALYRLAWDLAGTSFGTRHDLYERFFAGDYELQKVGAYMSMEKGEVVAMVRRLIRQAVGGGAGFPLPDRYARRG